MSDNIKKLGTVVSEGVIAGFWVAVGFNPIVRIGQVTLRETASVTDYSATQGFLAPSEFLVLIHFIVAAATIISLIAAWQYGGKTGVVALGCSFLGGTLVLSSFDLAALLIVIGYLLGLVGGILNQPNSHAQARPITYR